MNNSGKFRITGSHLLAGGAAAVLLSAAFLAGPARDTMDAVTAVAVLLHLGLGVLLILPIVWALARAAIQAENRILRLLLVSLIVLACLCAGAGLYLAARAATGHSTAHDPPSEILHTVSGMVAAALGALWLGWRRWKGRKIALSQPLRPLTLTAALLLVLTQGALFGAAALGPLYNAEEYYRDLTATTPAQAQNPLFPAGLRLPSAQALKRVQSGRNPIPASSACGVDGCHPGAFHEWQNSAHHFAGTDPFYLAARNESVRTSGPETVRWCQGCHAPSEAIRGASDAGPQTAAANEAEGIGCYTCHATTGTPTRTGNGRFLLAEPQDYPFAGAGNWRGGLHDFLLRVRPGPHQRAYLKPALHRTSEFCSACHRQSTTAAQNHYQFVRGPDEYGEWARGPASKRAARSVNSMRRQTCQECHFRDAANDFRSGKVSHGTPGGNTALAALHGNAVMPEPLLKRLRSGITLDLFALRQAGAPARSETVIAPIDRPRAPYLLRPGEARWLDVVVRNKGGGHAFPAGYPDLTDAWLELTVSDASGRTLGSSGVLADPQANVPAGAHAYGALGLDRTGAPILRHNVTEQITSVYHRTIPAGGSDIARFHFVVPNASAKNSALLLRVRLRYRSIRPDFARWALGGNGAPGSLAVAKFAVPITDLAEAAVTLPLARDADSELEQDAVVRQAVAERFEAYGAGLLAPLEKPDIGGAVYAFGAAGKLTPDRMEPWLGLGRAYLREPDLTLAAGNFERALRIAPGNPAAISELSVVTTKQGQPDRAIQALAPLAEAFPLDSALQYDLGLGLFRAGKYREAAESFRRALAIDPDQYAAHFQLKRCYEVLRRLPEARVEDSITRYMAEDRAAARLMPPYLAKHPAEAQSFPVHELR